MIFAAVEPALKKRVISTKKETLARISGWRDHDIDATVLSR
jgi:hypothetical protein